MLARASVVCVCVGPLKQGEVAERGRSDGLGRPAGGASHALLTENEMLRAYLDGWEPQATAEDLLMTTEAEHAEMLQAYQAPSRLVLGHWAGLAGQHATAHRRGHESGLGQQQARRAPFCVGVPTRKSQPRRRVRRRPHRSLQRRDAPALQRQRKDHATTSFPSRCWLRPGLD